MRRYTILALFLMFVASLSDSRVYAGTADETATRGRYLVLIGGCNDCHTPFYSERAGQIPESDWLTGQQVGFLGPWGTSYPSNLRISVDQMDEAQFTARARSEMLPPMPWFNLRAMSDTDLSAIYQFVKSLGSAGVPAPPYVAPGGEPKTPYIVFVPQSGHQETVAAK